MRVLLVNPPQATESVKSTFGKDSGAILPYGLLCIATWIEKHDVEVDIVDSWAERKSLHDLAVMMQHRRYDAVGVTAFTYSIGRAYAVAMTVKEFSPNSTVVIGGVHASVMPLEVLSECPACDYVVIGEGAWLTGKTALQHFRRAKPRTLTLLSCRIPTTHCCKWDVTSRMLGIIEYCRRIVFTPVAVALSPVPSAW